MNEASAPPATAAAEPQKLYKYQIRTTGGGSFEVESPYVWVMWWSIIKRDGYIVSDKGFIPYHAIDSMWPVGERGVGAIVPLGLATQDGKPVA